MSSVISDELGKWFEELQKIPEGTHLLCPRIDDDDEENYRIVLAQGSLWTRNTEN